MLITKTTEQISSLILVFSEVTTKYLDVAEPEISLHCSEEPDCVCHNFFSQ
jgi:hypothetical protein